MSEFCWNKIGLWKKQHLLGDLGWVGPKGTAGSPFLWFGVVTWGFTALPRGGGSAGVLGHRVGNHQLGSGAQLLPVSPTSDQILPVLLPSASWQGGGYGGGAETPGPEQTHGGPGAAFYLILRDSSAPDLERPLGSHVCGWGLGTQGPLAPIGQGSSGAGELWPRWRVPGSRVPAAPPGYSVQVLSPHPQPHFPFQEKYGKLRFLFETKLNCRPASEEFQEPHLPTPGSPRGIAPEPGAGLGAPQPLCARASPLTDAGLKCP